MNLQYLTLIASLAAWSAGGALLSSTLHAQEQEGFQELTRGPIHEAFATTVRYDPEPGMIVSKGPPELIEEIPPDQSPAGENVTWISGYWAWDQEESDFIWISGIWRNMPPDRQWVPGYWGDVDSGWQWTSGYWAEEELQEVVYLPQPPESVESGPNIAAPSSTHIWVSGTWVNRESRYAWRPGYWEPGQENWTWVPAHYQWTRRGYIFIEGYWDYNIHRRGVVFAPVRFQRDYYSRPNYSYTPSTLISLNVFLNHLFVRPNYGHYYFGDYYSPRYRNDGYYASFSYHRERRGYDPIYAYSRWENRSDLNWERSRRDNFSYYRDNEAARPPQTWAVMSSRTEGERRGSRDDYDFAQPLASYVEAREGRQRFEKVNKAKRDRYVAQRQRTREFTKDRRLIENRADERPARDRKNVRREKFAKSPIVSKRSEQLAASEAPPRRRRSRGKEAGEPRASADRANEAGERSTDSKKADKRAQRSETSLRQKADPAANKSESKNGKGPAKIEVTPKSKPETAPERKEMKKQESAPRKDAAQRETRQPAQQRQAQKRETPKQEVKQQRQARPEPKKQQAPEPQARKREAPKQEVKQQRQAPQRTETPRKQVRPAPEQKSQKAEASRPKRNKGEDEKKKK